MIIIDDAGDTHMYTERERERARARARARQRERESARILYVQTAAVGWYVSPKILKPYPLNPKP